MNIKEVAHKIRYWLTFHTDDIDRDTMYEALEVMDTAIEEGKAYKQIWGELDNGKYVITHFDKKGYLLESITPQEFKEKHFPKEVKTSVQFDIKNKVN